MALVPRNLHLKQLEKAVATDLPELIGVRHVRLLDEQCLVCLHVVGRALIRFAVVELLIVVLIFDLVDTDEATLLTRDVAGTRLPVHPVVHNQQVLFALTLDILLKLASLRELVD